MLIEFLTWWRDRLLELLPASLSGARSAQVAVVATPVDGLTDRISLSLRRGREERALGLHMLRSGARLPAGRLVLRLPPAMVLTRELTLPLAAERQLAQVVGYEIDRLTPFSTDELFWSCQIARRDREHGRLHVRLSLVPRAPLQPLLDAMEAGGLKPVSIEVPRDTARPGASGPADLLIDLRAAGPEAGAWSVRTDSALAALAAVLVVAVAVTPFALQARDMARLGARIAALRPQVDAVEAARRRIAAASAGIDVIATERLRLGDTLAVLATLTDLLPDDTSLTDLSLHQGKLTLGGQSAAAARLIGALSSDPMVRNPDFAAPVTRLADGHADLFSIRAEVAP